MTCIQRWLLWLFSILLITTRQFWRYANNTISETGSRLETITLIFSEILPEISHVLSYLPSRKV